MGWFNSGKDKPYQFRYYTAGESAHSDDALEVIKTVLDEKIKDQYHLEVINVFFKEKVAKTDGIFATPTLAKLQPPPIQKFFGGLNDIDRMRETLKYSPIDPSKGLAS